MIAYSANKRQFVDDVYANIIVKKIQDALGFRVGGPEISSWQNSLGFMERIVRDDAIPDDAGVAIEYQIPKNTMRVDFILTGKNELGQDSAVIIELKQWSKVEATTKDGIVKTWLGQAIREVPHPSYQAWTYEVLINDYNETVQSEAIKLEACAYLHNLDTNAVVNDGFYAPYTSKAPCFIQSDVEKLANFLKKYVKYGDAGNIMYRIENGRIRPSKSLVDHLVSMLDGNQEFLMIDDQKVVYETAIELAKSAQAGHKEVLLVHGGPGTGKSVVAINLLVQLIALELVANYVTKNAAPREVFKARLANEKYPVRIRNLFQGSGAYVNSAVNEFDALIADEAHRLNARSGMFQNKGENQIKEIINAAKFSVFFLDEDQRVHFKDIGEADAIRAWASKASANLTELSLVSQFRCNGSDGYLAWADHALQIRKTANPTLADIDYEFRVFDDPQAMHAEIEARNKHNNKSRMVAGYCWDWSSKNAPEKYDIEIGRYKARWNLTKDGSLWIEAPDSVAEVGCIHTCQGLELDYVGVIIGPDLIVRDGEVITDANTRSKNDSSIKGFKKLLKENPTAALEKSGLIIKNTYRTLMTRGMKGCFVYCTDLETKEYFRKMVSRSVAAEPVRQAAEDHPDYQS